MANQPYVGSVIEIVERRRHPSKPDTAGDQLVVPDEVRLNGQRLLVDADEPIRVHEIRDREPVKVTVTLLVKGVVIRVQEPDPQPRTFRKRPIDVQAMQWQPDQPDPVLQWLTAGGAHHAVLDDGRLGIGTLESGDGLDRHCAQPGDWVIKGHAGEFYACRREVFEATYDEPAAEAPAATTNHMHFHVPTHDEFAQRRHALRDLVGAEAKARR